MTEYSWMNGTCYEPRPLPVMYGRSRSWVSPFCILAVLAAVTGALIAVVH